MNSFNEATIKIIKIIGSSKSIKAIKLIKLCTQQRDPIKQLAGKYQDVFEPNIYFQ